MSLSNEHKDTVKSTEQKAQTIDQTKQAVPTSTNAGDEDDLDDLDDLLDDFADDVLNKPPGSAIGTETQEKDEAKTSADEPLNDEFKTRIEDLIKDLNIEDPETKVQFEQLVKQFEEDHKEEAAAASQPQNFDNVMKETMERLKKSGDTIDEQIKNDQSSGKPEDMLTQLLAGLGGPGGAGGDGDLDMSKLLVDMLEQLSSKEVLCEPIKDLHSKFPDYLKDKKGKISEEEHANYTKQYEISGQILAIFDAPDYNDEDKEKREKVNSLLESLQELGQPPTELVGDAGDFPGFGGMGGGALGGNGLDFNDKDLPPDLEKGLEEGCKQT
mmetsp:Transcript_8250/g.8176  ORF Transcript_8250/g.8176 Transcript_8250/m.8176 type:complete len:327 (+) Transcript_8250:402-1382(+)